MTCTSKVWGDALCRIQEEIPDFAFSTWITPLGVKVAHDRVVLGCPNSFHRDRVRIHYRALIERGLREALAAAGHSEECAIELVLAGEFTERTGRTLSSHEEMSGDRPTRERMPRQPMRRVAVDGPGVELAEAAGLQVQRGHPGARQPTTASASAGMAQRTANRPAPSIASGPEAIAAPTPPLSRGQASAVTISSAALASAPSSAPATTPTGTPARRGSTAQEAPAQPGSTGSTRSRPPVDPERTLQQELPFSFESFVVGPCNALAREAALALARVRQRSLNLLYLGGGSGMGKTHLARATATEARRHAIDTRGAFVDPRGLRSSGREAPGVVYTSAELFTSEFVSAMRNGRSEDFKRRYRAPIGLLVVEDIQFFSGRAKTQLELFHTVQHVLDAGGRVLLTGDRAPRELTGLDERVRAQVGRGFVAELEPPDAIVRRHILRSKAAAGGVRLPDECLDLLVDASQGSVRDIESVLIQVVTTASLLGRSIDLDLTREAIELKTSSASAIAPRKADVSLIVGIVAAFFGKRPEALACRSRRRDILVPRQLAMYLAHRYTDASFAEIGRHLGRGHPSVRNAIERIERQILESAPIRYQIEGLSERIDQTLKERSGQAP